MLRAIAMVAVLVLAACESPSPSPTPVLHGTFTLLASNSIFQRADGTCTGSGGYADITALTEVTVKNQAGDIIGITNLGDGKRGPATATHIATAVCTFSFSLAGLPDATFYSFEVGHRGEVNYSAEQMASSDWTVTLTLGS